MSEVTDVLDEDSNAPKPITEEQYEGAKAVLLYQLEQGLADPLLGLSTETEEHLLTLAYTDLVGLDRLERIVRSQIRERGDGEPAAKKFNLNTYRRGATQLRRQLAEAHARRAKLRERNLKLIQGGKDPGGTDVQVPDDTAISVQAMCEAQSVFLRAGGLLRTFRAGRVWFDEFHADYFTDWDGTASDEVLAPRKINDAFLLSVHQWLLMMDTRLGQSGTTNTEKAIYTFGNEDRRNEPREWLTALQWDGEERLPRLLAKAYGAPGDAYHAAVGRCWFVSMAARIMNPGCKVDTMPVLFGPQGTYKSTSLAVIGGSWYATINVSADGKDFLDALRGVLVAEIAEFDAFASNRVETSRIKTLLSTAVDRFRPAYGRTTQEFKRTAVLAATTNDPAWHRDDTGGRRFWPVHCGGMINTEWLKENREQLFAEALHRYREGESWSDVPRDAQEAIVGEHYAADPWEERIDLAIASWDAYTGLPGDRIEAIAGDPTANEERGHWGTMVTTNRIMTLALQLDPGRQSRREAIRVGAAMRRRGWVSKSVRTRSGEVVRCWVKSDASTGQGTLI